MALKLKLIRKQAFGELEAQCQAEKASWIEILRRLREALEQTFRCLSRCIDDDAENILSAESRTGQDDSAQWSAVREKYVQLSHNCISMLLELNSNTVSSQVVEDLQTAVNFFNKTITVSGGSSRPPAVVPKSASSKLESQKCIKWKATEEGMKGSVSTDGPCSSSSVISMTECKSAASRKSLAVRSNEERNVLTDSELVERSPVKDRRSSTETAEVKFLKSNHTVMSSSRSKDRHQSRRRSSADAGSSDPKTSQPQAVGPLLIFDSQGNPLTDHNGIPLINLNRKLVIKYKDDKPICHANGEPIFDEFGLPFVANFDQPLRDPEGKPLRLFNQENIPLTDSNGMVLKLNNGNYSIVLDEFNRILGDSFGSSIFDDKGKMLSGNLAIRNKQLSDSFGSQEDGTCIMLYNEKGFLLTDKRGKPLTTAAGQPLIEFGPNGEVTDMFGGSVYDENGKIYGSKARVPYLRVYDCDRHPLTNSRGDVLHDAGGRPLLIFDPSGKPISDSENRVLYDSNDVPCNDPDFQPYSEKVVKPRKAVFDFEIKIFNSRGRPMLDFDGSSLCNADGSPIVVMKSGKPFSDVEGNALFDEMGIPISQVNGTWTCPQGEPYRVFDCQGRPLTDKRGKDLYSINEQCLLKLDKAGRPVFTYMKGHVCDVNGVPVFDPLFDPSLTPPNDELRMQVFVGDSPLKVFDRFGKPLSDCNGMALVDSQGRCLIQFNEAGVPIGDITGATIFDENRLPLGCSQNVAIVSMNGLPFRLFDVYKRPLTDKNGYPLSLANDKPLLKFDGVGRPVSDLTGAPILDFRGRNVAEDPEARADSVLPEVDHVVKDSQGRPLQLFDAGGWPLTDPSGMVLVKADGTHLRLNHHGEPVADPLGGVLFDQFGTPLEEVLSASRTASDTSGELEFDKNENKDAFGRPLKDSSGTSQFDQYGRPLYDLYRRHVFDVTGRPLADAASRRLVDGRLEPTFKLPFDVRILSSAVKRSSLKKFNTGLHKDLLGGPLFDNDGIPLFNEYGKPTLDQYGRDLYDSQGKLQCDANGKPLSKQVKIHLNGRTIVDVKDVVKMIQVPKEMIPMMSSSLVVGKRVADSVILPGSCIMEGRHKQLSRGSRTYWALLRVTELSDNTIIHELLKASELDDDVENLATGDCTHLREQETSGTNSELDTLDNNPSMLNSEN